MDIFTILFLAFAWIAVLTTHSVPAAIVMILAGVWVIIEAVEDYRKED